MKVKYILMLLLVPFIFLIVCAIIVFCVTHSLSKPKVKYAEFPFKLTYELNGEVRSIEDIMVCEFDGFSIDEAKGKNRKWKTILKSGNERLTLLDLRNSNETGIYEMPILELFFDYGSGGYYMGDPNYKNAIPKIKDVIEYKYLDEDGTQGGWQFTSEEAYEKFGIRLISWECAPPIQNKFE